MAKMGIIIVNEFNKSDMKNKMYMTITKEVQFDDVVSDNLFETVFTHMTILLFPARSFGEQVSSIQSHQISYFVLRDWIAMTIGVAFMVGLYHKHVVL